MVGVAGYSVARREKATECFLPRIKIMQEPLTAYDEAIEEGEIKNNHRVLLQQGRKRFGPPEATVEQELKSIRDLERLDRLTIEILTAKSWSELLATP